MGNLKSEILLPEFAQNILCFRLPRDQFKKQPQIIYGPRIKTSSQTDWYSSRIGFIHLRLPRSKWKPTIFQNMANIRDFFCLIQFEFVISITMFGKISHDQANQIRLITKSWLVEKISLRWRKVKKTFTFRFRLEITRLSYWSSRSTFSSIKQRCNTSNPIT